MFYSYNVGFTQNKADQGQVEISDESWNEIIMGQSKGMVIKANADGYPVLEAPPEQTKEEKIVAAKAEKDLRKSQIVKAISVYQMKIQVGRKLTATETASLNAWLDYSDAVDAIETSITSTDVPIIWPVQPEA